ELLRRHHVAVVEPIGQHRFDADHAFYGEGERGEYLHVAAPIHLATDPHHTIINRDVEARRVEPHAATDDAVGDVRLNVGIGAQVALEHIRAAHDADQSASINNGQPLHTVLAHQASS